jgi:multicomponent Na+:H+ antiporter subunit E
MRHIVSSMLMALAWMPLTANISLGSFVVGFLLSFAVLTLLFRSQDQRVTIKWQNLPDQALAGVVYMLILFRDIYLSAIDVSKRVLNPAMPLNPGIIGVSTQLTPEDQGEVAQTIAAISAHGITITPGELVVDFDGTQIMYVHCLDVVASLQVGDSNQAKRMGFMRRIFNDHFTG